MAGGEIRKRCALVVAHPGHELRVYGWLALRKPDVYILTDGSGHTGNSRLDSWATEEDVRCLLEWERLFGAGFRAAFVFVYWCESQPPAPLFEEVLEFKDRWYVVRVAMAREYAQVMKPRSPKWRTVHVPGAAFDRLSRNLCGSLAGEPTASAAAGSLYTPPRPQ